MNAPHLPGPSAETSRHRTTDLIGRLRASSIFGDYRQAFQTATGLPLALRAAGSFQSPMHGARNVNPFCAMMAAKSRSCAACLQTQQRIETEALAGPCTLECFAGLNDTAVPVRIGETMAGYLQTGQVMFRAPTERRFRTALAELARLNAPASDVAELRAAFFQSRVLARDHYDSIVRLLASFASHLALVANELALQEAAAEPPAVTRARAFIAERPGEEISLKAVAAAAHMSAFYFCKVFKAATGLTLTDYVARVRVERVKQELLNPHVRVSEAAYAAGFQSLSQFNRVFRRIVGKAPTVYRDDLHHRVVAAGRPGAPLPFAA